MLLSAPPVPVLAIGGGAGSGKTALATKLAQALPGTRIVHLDGCFHTLPGRAPAVPAIKGHGFVIDYSDPEAMDWDLVQQALDAAVDDKTHLIVVEGTFALLPVLCSLARWSVYVDTPSDVRLARKTLRKISEGADPEIGLRGYLDRGRDAYARHIAPMQRTAGFVLDGTFPTSDLVQQLTANLELVRP